ncbi:DNA-binding transcriptional LysR family regulator [Kineococcus radiotolerans]|uniref:DNA-binding transcriptional LysR family regulator n=1 Tax=Kineococcus radiotolerans TaxID=131568 RepID=A0A7W4TMJ9_KINRA|nr:LysR family transcriptional regulator [Kineococcus radiotolerans]MBB2901685.1 DNA-binding transcriptional LysR family regulator [Kineococcus radiotolerans]
MDLRQMQYVVALADERQFTRAAALSGVSQSGLSAAIRTLEDELGATLFDRSPRRVEPTDAGLALLPFARTLLAQATAARDAVVQATRRLSGTLRVGAEQCLGVVDVSTLLERFHRRFPQVEIHFEQAGSHDLLSRLREGELDLVFVATTEHLGALPASELGREPLVLLTPPEHPLAGRPHAPWAELAAHPFIDFVPSWGVRPITDAACAAHGVHRRVRFSVGDVHALLDLVGRGLGIAIVPRHVAAKPQAARLAVVPMPPGTPEWVVSVVTSAGSSPAPQLLELLEVEQAGTVETATVRRNGNGLP